MSSCNNSIRSRRYPSNQQVYGVPKAIVGHDAGPKVSDQYAVVPCRDMNVGNAPPPSYEENLRALNQERLSALTRFDKHLKKKVGIKGAKGAAGGTIIGGAIFGGVVATMVSHSTVTGGVMAKAGAALAAAHFWPVAVFLGCAVIGGLVGMAFKRAKVTRLARQERLGGEAEKIRTLRDALIGKREAQGSLTKEEEQVVKACSRILSRFHINPFKALGEMTVGTLVALPVAAGLAAAIVALFAGGDGGGGGGGGGGWGSGGGGGGGSGSVFVTDVLFWNPYPVFGPGDSQMLSLRGSSGPNNPDPRLQRNQLRPDLVVVPRGEVPPRHGKAGQSLSNQNDAAAYYDASKPSVGPQGAPPEDDKIL